MCESLPGYDNWKLDNPPEYDDEFEEEYYFDWDEWYEDDEP